MITELRKKYITKYIMDFIKKNELLPKISQTEKEALTAGDTWIESHFFSGSIDFNTIYSEPLAALSKEEQDFLDNEANTVCTMTDDSKVFAKRDLDEEVFEYLKVNKFFGMIIPKKYGGLGFTAIGHSAVIQKMASRSQVLAITTMVPNSLGPAELILHYGTQKQKEHYLPRLADGRDIPCFALTEPLAGSDATAISSSGKVIKDSDGTIKIELTFNKRYITLGAIATVIGLAFKLYDPDHLLSNVEELGITCALVNSNTNGVVLGRRHDPLNVPFVNSPISGKNVQIDIDDVIGAKEGIGKGWIMLMESLSVGRGISLPSTSCGGVKLCADVARMHAVTREQFNLSIGKFEAISNELTMLLSSAFILNSSRIFTLGAIDSGVKPSVINAVMKYHSTEMFRDSVNSAMDILGGTGISLGKNNLIGYAYMGAPIAITVEGANIMTRSLIQFGQGVIRSHPFVTKEVDTLENDDLDGFDKVLFAHIGFGIKNFVKATALTLTRGHLYLFNSKYEKKLIWSSAIFALLSDMVLAYYGGNLKRKELISGRFADIMSNMYLLTAILRVKKSKNIDEDLFEYSASRLTYNIQIAYEGLFNNLGKSIFSRFLFKILGFLTSINTMSREPNDILALKISNKFTTTNCYHDIVDGIYVSSGKIASQREIFDLHVQAQNAIKKVKDAIKNHQLLKKHSFKEAVEFQVLSQSEYEILEKLKELKKEAIEVDSYTLDEYYKRVQV
jgi:acyl-CoA dehydrogenase